MAHHWRVDAWWNHDGAAGDLLGTVLYWPLGLELTDMTQDEVIQLMRKVIKESEYYTTWTVSTPHLVELVERAVEAEREAILDLVDSYAKNNTDLADAIRARGNT
jgi:hypothetical protein